MSQIRQPTQPNPGTPDSDYESAAQQFYALMLRAVRYSIPAYDYWEPTTIGGKTGKYQIATPFETTCEYRILQFVSSDIAYCYVGKRPNQLAPTNGTNIGGDPSFGSPVPDPGLPGIVFSGIANTTSPGPDEWLPMAANDQLLIDINCASSHAAWVTILFRRRRQASGVFLEGA